MTVWVIIRKSSSKNYFDAHNEFINSATVVFTCRNVHRGFGHAFYNFDFTLCNIEQLTDCRQFLVSAHVLIELSSPNVSVRY